MKKLKYKDIPRTIEMPVYFYDESEYDDINGNDYVYDFDEMADELTDRISNDLDKNVHISIIEIEEDK